MTEICHSRSFFHQEDAKKVYATHGLSCLTKRKSKSSSLPAMSPSFQSLCLSSASLACWREAFSSHEETVSGEECLKC